MGARMSSLCVSRAREAERCAEALGGAAGDFALTNRFDKFRFDLIDGGEPAAAEVAGRLRQYRIATARTWSSYRLARAQNGPCAR